MPGRDVGKQRKALQDAISMMMLWRRLDIPGHEWCRFKDERNRKLIDGIALIYYQRKPCRLNYAVECDANWRTSSVTLQGQIGTREISLQLEVDDNARWIGNGQEITEVEGCLDVDLGFSPSTNALPINRLSLQEGIPVDVTAAWVEFPSMRVRPLLQTYTRLSEQIIRYESRRGRFKRDIAVNRHGFVIHYPDYWQSEAETQ